MTENQNDPGNGWVIDTTIAPGLSLRQGDLIKFEGEKDQVKNVGIVVTADCDLDKKKHSRILTLVPVLSAKTTIEYCLLPEEVEGKSEQIEDYAFRKFFIDSRQDRAIKLAMLRAAVLSTPPVPGTPEFIATEFVFDRLNCVPINDYKVMMRAMGMEPKGVDALKNKIKSRGDLFVLPSTDKLKMDNCVAWVRHIWQVPLTQVAVKTSQTSKMSGERVARLDSPYRYRLTQLMAHVFSDIGLPDEPNFIDKLVEDTYRNG